MNLRHGAVVIRMPDNILHFILVTLLTHLKNKLLRAHFAQKVADHGCVFSYSNFVFFSITISHSQIIDSADGEYSLLEVL